MEVELVVETFHVFFRIVIDEKVPAGLVVVVNYGPSKVQFQFLFIRAVTFLNLINELKGKLGLHIHIVKYNAIVAWRIFSATVRMCIISVTWD